MQEGGVRGRVGDAREGDGGGMQCGGDELAELGQEGLQLGEGRVGEQDGGGGGVERGWGGEEGWEEEEEVEEGLWELLLLL